MNGLRFRAAAKIIVPLCTFGAMLRFRHIAYRCVEPPAFKLASEMPKSQVETLVETDYKISARPMAMSE